MTTRFHDDRTSTQSLRRPARLASVLARRRRRVRGHRAPRVREGLRDARDPGQRAAHDLRAPQRGALVGPLDALHAGRHRARPALPVRRRSVAPGHGDPPHARGAPVARATRCVRLGVLLGGRPVDVGPHRRQDDLRVYQSLPRDRRRHLRRCARRVLRVRVPRAIPAPCGSMRRRPKDARRDFSSASSRRASTRSAWSSTRISSSTR